MSVLGLDFSHGKPRASVVKDEGYRFVIMYCGNPSNPKNATPEAVRDYISHGIGVCLVFESTANRAGQGKAAGIADAKAAVADQARLGIPASRPIYFAVDFDASVVTILPYFQGVHEVPGPDGAYGSFTVVEKLRSLDYVMETWQTVAWSHGQVSTGKSLFQRLGTVVVDGVQCDVNEAFQDDFGQYPYSGDVDMPLTDADIRKIAIAILDVELGPYEDQGARTTLADFVRSMQPGYSGAHVEGPGHKQFRQVWNAFYSSADGPKGKTVFDTLWDTQQALQDLTAKVNALTESVNALTGTNVELEPQGSITFVKKST